MYCYPSVLFIVSYTIASRSDKPRLGHVSSPDSNGPGVSVAIASSARKNSVGGVVKAPLCTDCDSFPEVNWAMGEQQRANGNIVMCSAYDRPRLGIPKFGFWLPPASTTVYLTFGTHVPFSVVMPYNNWDSSREA